MENNIIVKTKEEIIKETYEYYKADPVGRRSTDTKMCLYYGNNGQKCAFSRCCKEDDETVDTLRSVEGEGASTVIDMFDVLKPEYNINDRDFWDELQSFHDKEYNWNLNNNTISEKGEETYKYLLNKYKGQ